MKLLHRIFLGLTLLASFKQAQSQTESPYKTSWKVDAPIIGAGVGLSVLGVSFIKNKDGLTEQQVNSVSKSDVNGTDRFIAGNYSTSADKASYYPFYASFAMPVALLLNKNEGSKAGQIVALYIETMAITGALYSNSAGLINRNRPFVYSDNAPMDKKTSAGARRSFYAGHTAATAAATFFAAKVFQDFNPDSKAKPYVWAAAAIVPASVAYLRSKAGMHFLTDNLLGYALGAGAGILVPQLHKKTNKTNLTLTPVITPEYKYATLACTF
ncbi:phosphatase PAP2 family protein [Pedobacter sp. HMF7647]|uniref:Phosphatase PAP2 family protein n=1 Tax=Hufsiella arboris TaxID=2695275 RepID=A0A7K1YAT6_9SPHI|nr:phosphatase PAP2 family protein [Hufsiella arboris]MXV51219.1 phosphatase PAP2 family protein [Hufsiella arboris]